MKFKHFLSMTAALCLCLTMAACGETAEEKPAETAAETTTTAATTTAAPETTTAATTTTEPETTTTEATTTEEPETTTTEPAITTMEDNPDGMYPMSECFRRVVEDYSGSKVISIEYDDLLHGYVATNEKKEKYFLSLSSRKIYDSGEMIHIEQLKFSEFFNERDVENGLSGRFDYWAYEFLDS